jgi:putative hydrolase of the HAD superfamily
VRQADILSAFWLAGKRSTTPLGAQTWRSVFPSCRKAAGLPRQPHRAGERRHPCRMLVVHGKVRSRISAFREPNPMPKAIFFDAVGTLFYLTKTVGDHYAFVAEEVGLKLDANKLDAMFYSAWKQMPLREAIDGPRENDDKDWWRELVDLVLKEAAPTIDELDRDNFFEVAYEHFAEAGVWELYPEVVDVLEQLRPRFELAIVSNFDGRLRIILERLGISKYFRHLFVSSEIGADKPDPEIFRRALKFLDLQPGDVLHVGDDPERDWSAATAAGLSIFQLDRNKNSLRDLILLL